MNERRTRWNERHARGEETHGFAPSSPLLRAIEGRAPGEALDVACGSGRHAITLAEKGFRVVAVDYAEAALDAMMAEARRRGVAAHIEPRVADIEAGELLVEPGRFDVVCDFYFLHRPLFAALREGVSKGGLFVAAIHVQGGDSAAPHRFLLAPGELRDMVSAWGFEILHAAEGVLAEGAHPTSEIVARRPPSHERAAGPAR